MIHFDGTEHFSVPPSEAAAKLSDAGWLARALPDVEVTTAEPDRAAWKVRPKLSFLSGTLDTTAEVTAREPGRSVRYRIHSKSVGAASTVEATLTFRQADGGGTAVAWTGGITELTGLLKLAPRGLVQATAGKAIADVWAAVRAALI
jgi:uncharacterized protein